MKTMARFLLPYSFIIITGLFSCQKQIGDNESLSRPHPIVVYLTDHQTPIFDSVFIDLQGLDVKLEDDSLTNGGWISLSINPGVYNILRFRNGLDTLFATGTIPNARIRKIRMRLGTQNSVMKDRVRTPLTVKDQDREVIANVDASNFEIASSGQVFFWIDFDAGNSIQPDNSGSGNGNGFRLQSHIKIFTTGRTGRIEGFVLPRAAEPIVKAARGSDTATAIPDGNDGKFKIVGLNAGIYTVLIDGQHGFNDTTLFNITVRNGEDTRLPTIILH